ncbi:hypothetical protein OIO90_000666 [Microbotryomycetes sp. JL221]|nr:hypothetical protein OIO90_000666 [Microbotryomycetes sp. JL221]
MPGPVAVNRQRDDTHNNQVDGRAEVASVVDVQFGSNEERAKACRHLFVQAMINRRIVSEKLATNMYMRASQMCGIDDLDPFASFLTDVNDSLAPVMLEIKRARDQETGMPQLVMTNQQSDAVAKIATDFIAAEIAFFRSIIEAIVRAPRMSYAILLKDAIKLYTGTNRQAAQDIVKSLVAKGWLRILPSGHLILSTRSLSELSRYIQEQFNHDEDEDDEDEANPARDRAIVQCHACFDPVTIGYACPNKKCDVRLHKFCVAQRVGQTGRCPDSLGNPGGCTREWFRVAGGKFEGVPVGVEALGVGGSDSLEDQLASDNDEQDQDEEEPAPSSQARANGSGRRTTGRTGRGQQGVDDDEDDEMD